MCVVGFADSNTNVKSPVRVSSQNDSTAKSLNGEGDGRQWDVWFYNDTDDTIAIEATSSSGFNLGELTPNPYRSFYVNPHSKRYYTATEDVFEYTNVDKYVVHFIKFSIYSTSTGQVGGIFDWRNSITWQPVNYAHSSIYRFYSTAPKHSNLNKDCSIPIHNHVGFEFHYKGENKMTMQQEHGKLCAPSLPTT